MIIAALKDIVQAYREYYVQALLFGTAGTVVYTAVVLIRYLFRVISNQETRPFGRVFLSIPLFAVFSFYFSYVVYLTLSGREAGSRDEFVNLQLFSTLLINDRLRIHGVENVLLFVPFGVLLPCMMPFFRKWYRVMFAGMLCSTVIELTQLLTGRGFFELDDIVLNTAGALTGALVYLFVSLLFRLFSGSIFRESEPK